MSDESFICSTCGQEHSGLPTDYAYGLPDEVYLLPYLEQYRRSRSNADSARSMKRVSSSEAFSRFLFASSDEEFGWGVWVEVNKEQHDLYLAGYYDDLSDNPPFEARLANTLPPYEESLGLVVEVQLRSGSDRPAFQCSANAVHQLAREQRGGITTERHHQILEPVGFFDRE